jgi:hypothetical protein
MTREHASIFETEGELVRIGAGKGSVQKYSSEQYSPN